MTHCGGPYGIWMDKSNSYYIEYRGEVTSSRGKTSEVAEITH